VGARNSSNSNRLRELGERLGVESHLVQGAQELQEAWFHPRRRVGLAAGASAPEVLVQEVIAELARHGELELTELEGAISESICFRLPDPLVSLHAGQSSADL
jgi:4-hydroxy-3-methylbut-2-enyl diphosphate reductase